MALVNPTGCILVSALLRAEPGSAAHSPVLRLPCGWRQVLTCPWSSDSSDPSLQRCLRQPSCGHASRPATMGSVLFSMFLETDATLLAKMWSRGQSIPWEPAGNAESWVHTALPGQSCIRAGPSLVPCVRVAGWKALARGACPLP